MGGMDPLGLVKTWRKAAAFAAGLLPLRRPRERWRRLVHRLGAWPPLARAAARIEATRPWRAARVVVRRFWWRDHSGDEIDFDAVPRPLAATLRVALLFVAAALLLIPVSARWCWPPVPVAVEGFEVAEISGITLVVVAAGIAVGWGTLLAGAARTNLLAFVAAAVAMSWMMVPLGTAAPARWPLLAVPAVLLWTATRSTAPVGGTWPRRVVLALVIGPLAALAAVRSAGGWAWHGSGTAALAAVSVACVLASLALLSRAGRLDPQRALGPDAAAATAGIALLLAAAWHGAGTPATVSAVALHLSAVDGLLWAVWAFIGVGLVYKLLKETRALATALDLLAPGRMLPAVGLVLLAGVAVLGFAEYALLGLASLLPASPLPLLLFRAWLGLNAWPDWFETLRVMRWVALAGLAALAYLRARGALDRSRGMAVGYLLLLSGVVVYEYAFELGAFRHDEPLTDRVLVPFLFVLWVMWLVYSVGLRMATGDSPRWSRAGRTGVYAGAVVLIAVTLHLSAVAAPSTMADRTFLQLFLACLYVGVPYVLWVYLTRRHGSSPVPAARMFGAFVLGILCQLPVHLLSRAALGGWSWEGLTHLVRQAEQALLAHGTLPSCGPPTAWVAIAAAVALGALLRLAALAAIRPHPLTAVAVFTGFGSGAVMPLTLPLLPTAWQVALAPLQRDVTLTLGLATHHAEHLVLALLVAHAVLRHRRTGAVAGVAAAAAVELGVTALLRRQADYLALSGLGWAVLASLILAAGLLLWGLERRLSSRLDRAPDGGGEPRREDRTSAPSTPALPPLVPPAHLAVMAALVAVAIAGAAALAAYHHRLVPQRMEGFAYAVPANWQPFASPEVQGAWVRLHPAGMGLLLVDADPIQPGQSAAAALAASDERFAAAVEDFAVVDTWRDGPFTRRRARFTAPAPGGEPWPQLAEQILIPRGSLLLSWTVTGDAAAFPDLLLDFARVRASLRPLPDDP